jgi:hypothetical protein
VSGSRIYVEGGGESKEMHARCREGFRTLLENSGFKGRVPRIVACGGRDAAYDAFATVKCTNAYAKNKRSFEALASVEPAVLAAKLPAFARMRRILSGRL